MRLRIKLLNKTSVLGSCPSDPNTYQTYLIDKHNEIIKNLEKYAKESGYPGQEEISEATSNSEISSVFYSIESAIGRHLTDEEKEELLRGGKEGKALLKSFGESISKSTIFLKDEQGLPYLSPHVLKGYLKKAATAICKLRTMKKSTFLWSERHSIYLINYYFKPSPVVFEDEKGNRLDIRRKEDGKPEYLSRPLRAKTPLGERVALASSEVVDAPIMAFDLTISDYCDVSLKDIKELFNFGEFHGIGQWANSGTYGIFSLLECEEIED